MNRKYNLKLDFQFKCSNSNVEFNKHDLNTSDFYINITRDGKEVDLSDAIITLLVIKPSGKVDAQFLSFTDCGVYGNLKPSLKDEVGNYQCKVMVNGKDEAIVIDQVIEYTVNEDKFIAAFSQNMVTDDDYSLLTDMLRRLSSIETDEEQRQLNEADRILKEELRQVSEADRVEAELIREHNDADREKAEATRNTNENNRKKAETLRVNAENERVGAESGRVEAENLRVEAERSRVENYEFMTSDEDRRRNEENSRIEAEKLRVQAEIDRVNEERKRKIVEQARVSEENKRVSNEATRVSNEGQRASNEDARVQAERNRASRYESFITDAESSVSSFNSYVSDARAEEEKRKASELSRVELENKRKSNEAERVSNENVRKSNEVKRVEAETIRQSKFDAKVVEVNSKVNEVNAAKNTMVADTKKAIDKMTNDFNSLSASQQQDAEVVLARDGEESLNARLKRDLEKGKLVDETLEGAYISCNDTVDGIIKDIEIFGNTVQSPTNLSDIKSVGIDNGDGTYNVDVVSCGKNLVKVSEISATNANTFLAYRLPIGKVKPNTQYVLSYTHKASEDNVKPRFCITHTDGTLRYHQMGASTEFSHQEIVSDANKTIAYIHITFAYGSSSVVYTAKGIQLEEGIKSTPFEEYKEDKCTIKLPCQLEKVGDFADRLYFDKVENAWCIEKNNFIKSTRDLDYKGCSNTVLENTYRLSSVAGVGGIAKSDMYGYKTSLCSRFPFIQGEYWTRDEEHYYLDINSGSVVFFINKSECGERKEDVIKYMQDIDAKLYLVYKEPKKIVLPLDVQIQLNQFLGATNAWLECGEVDGTIKATFSKSIASTVQANTKAINDMDNRIKGVEGLKESQDMAYTTDKGCLICKETKNGTVKDLRVSGKSLVNKAIIDIALGHTNTNTGEALSNIKKGFTSNYRNAKPSTEYVAKFKNVVSNKARIIIMLFNDDRRLTEVKTWSTDINEMKFTTTQETNRIVMSVVCDDAEVSSQTLQEAKELYQPLLLESSEVDLCNGYFEGIASVGNGVDKIEVLSMNNGNILNSELVKAGVNGDTGKLSVSSSGSGTVTQQEIIPVVPNMKLYYKSTGERTFRGGGNTFLYKYGVNNEYLGRDTCVTFNPIDIPSNCHGVRVAFTDFELSKDYPAEKYGVVFSQFESFVDTPVKQDKKAILFKDIDGSWKPIKELRGLDTVCDTIELHSDSKYYYHQRTFKSVLSGEEAEKWFRYENVEILTKTYTIKLADTIKRGGGSLILCDKFKYVPWDKFIVDSVNYISHVGTNHIYITHNESTSVEVFKQWLQTNPITVITELAEEKVFKVNPLFLESFEGEAMMSINSGVINAPLEFKIASYITNLVLLNQQRISMLEEQVMGMFKSVLNGDMRTLAETLYPQDFVLNDDEIMLLNK